MDLETDEQSVEDTESEEQLQLEAPSGLGFRGFGV